MTFPFVPGQQAGLVLAVFIGFGFGFVLERAGFGRAGKLAAQFYGYDMTVLKVMFTAIVTATLGIVLASALGLADFEALAERAASGTFLLPMIAGGFLLGAGFVVSGYCPGTSFVAMASGKIDGLLTVLGVMAGQVLWAELEWRSGFSAFHEAGGRGNLYLWQLVHLPSRTGPAVVALGVGAMALGCFIGAERLEKALASRCDALARTTPACKPGRWVLAALALAALVGLGALAVPPAPRARPRLAEPITAADLARRVFDAPWTVRVLDVRELERCSARRVPGAECLTAQELASLRLGDDDGSRDLVVVGSGEATDVPAATLAYPGRLLALRGGWKSWEEYALTPPLQPPPDATAADLEAYRLRTGIQAALTGSTAAPPPPRGSLAPTAPRAGAGGGCGG